MGGARVLGAEQEIGSIEPGKKADLVLLETESVNMFPIYNVYSAIVYSANASNVDSVWVDGKRLVKNHRLLCANMAGRKKLSDAMGEFASRAEKYPDVL